MTTTTAAETTANPAGGTTTAAGAIVAGVPGDDAIRSRGATNAAIRSISEIAGLDRTWADAQIDAGRSADEARAAAFQEMQTRRQRSAGGATIDNRSPAGQITSGYSADDPATMRRSMADALAHRLAPAAVKLEGAGTAYRSMPVLAMAGKLLSARGERVDPWDRESLLTRAIGAHSTSDFPLLLADAANKALLSQYQAAAPTYRSIASRKSFNDFKSHKFLRLGDFPAFAEVAEGGPTVYGTVSENKETVTPSEFATGLAIGRKALLNDDLAALSGFAEMVAIAAARFENQKVYSLLSSTGPTMSDGYALFNAANHANYQSSGTTIANGIDAAVLAFRSQTSLDGNKINVPPKYLIVGATQEVKARQQLAAINPTQTSNVNVWAGAFELVVDSEITGAEWYLSADPAQVPTLVYGYLNGAEGPQITTETDFDTKCVKVRAGLDFGCGVIDWRGIYKNAGA